MKLIGKFTSVAVAAGGIMFGVNTVGSATDTPLKNTVECVVKDKDTTPGLVIYKNTCSVQLNTFACGTGLPDIMGGRSGHSKNAGLYSCREDVVEARGVLFSESVTEEHARSEKSDNPAHKEIQVYACVAPKKPSDNFLGVRECR